MVELCLWNDIQTIATRMFTSNHTYSERATQKERRHQVLHSLKIANRVKDTSHFLLLKIFFPNQIIITYLMPRTVISTTAKLTIFIGEERSKHANFTIPLHLKVKYGRMYKDTKACTKYLLVEE